MKALAATQVLPLTHVILRWCTVFVKRWVLHQRMHRQRAIHFLSSLRVECTLVARGATRSCAPSAPACGGACRRRTPARSLFCAPCSPWTPRYARPRSRRLRTPGSGATTHARRACTAVWISARVKGLPRCAWCSDSPPTACRTTFAREFWVFHTKVEVSRLLVVLRVQPPMLLAVLWSATE